MVTSKKKVAFHTLGCKLNFAETSTISRSLPGEHFERVSANEKADIYIINTCSVTEAADRKCRQAIKKFIHRSPDAFIAVVGCYAQLKPQDISSIPGVDLVLGSNEKFNLNDYLKILDKRTVPDIHSGNLMPDDNFSSAWSAGDRTRSFLKVQDGCDYSCSYCTIPLARGKSRNPDIRVLADEAKKIADSGIKEIVLTGVNSGDFGKSTGDSFTDLLRRLAITEGIERIRLSSIEPDLLTDEMIEFIAENKKILPHFHLPLQSGSNKILGLMRRRYRREHFAGRVEKIKAAMPFAGIGADVIVGFPGESKSDFEETFSFLEQNPLSYLHVFTYSERPGTVAQSLPLKIPPAEKEIRSKRLIRLSEDKALQFNVLNMNQITNVLFEWSGSKEMITGFTENYIKVEFPRNNSIAGKIKRVRLTGVGASGNMTVELLG
jgi:threonylcarbamoyladenosine tRNA methylthiotransferase MtaB